MKAIRKGLKTLALAAICVIGLSGCYLLDGRHYRAVYNNLGDETEQLQKDIERYFFNYDWDSPHDNY